jgi:hypothetical protein
MKMTTEITHRYFEFNPKNEADYYALISTNTKEEAINMYYDNVSDRDMEPDVDCLELSSPEAWNKLKNCDDSEAELSIEEKLEEFESNGVLLWPRF